LGTRGSDDPAARLSIARSGAGLRQASGAWPGCCSTCPECQRRPRAAAATLANSPSTRPRSPTGAPPLAALWRCPSLAGAESARDRPLLLT